MMYIHVTALCSARTTQTRRAIVAKASRERRNPVATCRATVAKASRERRKGVARTSQTCRAVSRVCRKVSARPSQRHRATYRQCPSRPPYVIVRASDARLWIFAPQTPILHALETSLSIYNVFLRQHIQL